MRTVRWPVMWGRRRVSIMILCDDMLRLGTLGRMWCLAAVFVTLVRAGHRRRGESALPGSSIYNIYTESTQYLHSIYTVSTQYIHSIYTLSTQFHTISTDYLHSIYTLSARWGATRCRSSPPTPSSSSCWPSSSAWSPSPTLSTTTPTS